MPGDPRIRSENYFFFPKVGLGNIWEPFPFMWARAAGRGAPLASLELQLCLIPTFRVAREAPRPAPAPGKWTTWRFWPVSELGAIWEPGA